MLPATSCHDWLDGCDYTSLFASESVHVYITCWESRIKIIIRQGILWCPLWTIAALQFFLVPCDYLISLDERRTEVIHLVWVIPVPGYYSHGLLLHTTLSSNSRYIKPIKSFRPVSSGSGFWGDLSRLEAQPQQLSWGLQHQWTAMHHGQKSTMVYTAQPEQ